MSQPRSAVYASIVSNRSRRLRTIATVLLFFVLGMAGYGVGVLMPSVRSTVVQAGLNPNSTQVSTPAAPTAPLHVSRHDARVIRFKVLFAYAYWSVWMALTLSMLFVVWLDLREVARNYGARRMELWNAATLASRAQSESESKPESGQGQ